MKAKLKRDKKNKKVDQRASAINFIGAIFMMIVVMLALFRMLVLQAPFKETLGILVVALLIYGFFRAFSWFVSGFKATVKAPPEKEVAPEKELAPVASNEGAADGVNSYMDKRFG